MMDKADPLNVKMNFWRQQFGKMGTQLHKVHQMQDCLFFLIYLFLAALGLCCWAQAFSSCRERGLLFIAVHRLLIVVVSLVVEHGL